MKKHIIFFFIVCFTTTNIFAGSEHMDGVIVDKKNNIYWQDNQSSQETSEDWDDALLYCDKLDLNDLEQWRLPTFKELFSTIDFTRHNPAINSKFQYVTSTTYWTSTSFSNNRSRAWNIDFKTGKTYFSYKTTNHAVRCVKDISPNTTKESK